MSLRIKLALAFALLAAMVAIVADTLSYNASRSELYGQIDQSLVSSSQALARSIEERSGLRQLQSQNPSPLPDQKEEQPILPPPGRGALGNQVFVTQYLSVGGTILLSGEPRLPVGPGELAVAKRGRRGAAELSTISVNGEQLRMATTSLAGGGAIQIARSTEDANKALDALRSQAITLTIILVILAALLGFFLAHFVVRPLGKLTRTAERVADSGRPDAEITVVGNDEIGRLGRVLARMLSSLNQSQRQQERLVQDAGHELRTPLTSMTTNISLLDHFDRLSKEQRKQLVHDLANETKEMAQMVDELVELTTIGAKEGETIVDLDHLAAEAAAQGQRRWGREIKVAGHSGQIEGRPRALRHALTNLLDNAVKFSPPDSTITIQLDKDNIEVIDSGPGIPAGEEGRIFERFYRTVETRSQTGSGLGLSIVAEVASLHGGQGFARTGPGGKVGFSFKRKV